MPTLLEILGGLSLLAAIAFAVMAIGTGFEPTSLGMLFVGLSFNALVAFAFLFALDDIVDYLRIIAKNSRK